jgi:L-serine dehydratase
MYISLSQMFKIGLGPLNSQTVGPMRAAKQFISSAKHKGYLHPTTVKEVKVDLYGTYSQTEQNPATTRAIKLGLLGEDPDNINITELYPQIAETNSIKLLKEVNSEIKLNYLNSQRLPFDTEAVRFTLIGKNDEELFKDIWYSVGCGNDEIEEPKQVPFEFKNAKQLFKLCEENKLTIPQLILENEKVFNTEAEIKAKIDRFWKVMKNGIERGINTFGTLPEPYKINRRAAALYRKLQKLDQNNPMTYLNWINVYALAVGEDNTSGGQVVASPTNVSAGVIPAVLKYYERYHTKTHPNKIYDFFLTASAIGSLFKLNSNIPDIGCQTQIGISSTMAAAGLTCALGGDNMKIEKASVIAMEHFMSLNCKHLGLTQIPCIESNADGAVQAINAASLALAENTPSMIDLDRIIIEMKNNQNFQQSKVGLVKDFENDVLGSIFGNRMGNVRMDLSETIC